MKQVDVTYDLPHVGLISLFVDVEESSIQREVVIVRDPLNSPLFQRPGCDTFLEEGLEWTALTSEIVSGDREAGPDSLLMCRSDT